MWVCLLFACAVLMLLFPLVCWGVAWCSADQTRSAECGVDWSSQDEMDLFDCGVYCVLVGVFPHHIFFLNQSFFFVWWGFLPWVRLATCPKTAVALNCLLKIILLAHPITHTWLSSVLVLVLLLWNCTGCTCFLLTCFCWYQLFHIISFSNGCV